MNISKKGIITVIVLVAMVSILTFSYFGKKGCSVTYWLNPDTVCRVLDERGDRLLVEYFNVDTNDLRLYLQQNGKEVSIMHPYGHVSNYSENINSNEIKLDTVDSLYILVNGERFEIVILK